MKYVVPPEHHMFERDSKYLILDPVNFIWFVTDDKGKAMFDGLAQTQEMEGAIQSLAHLVGMNPDDPSIAVYVSKFVAHLVEIGILHEGEYKHQEIGTGILDSPKILYIHLTSKCNLKCPYCYNQEHRAELIQIGRSPDSASLSTEGHTDDFLKIVDEAAELGFYQVKLTGGEALLNKDVLRIAKRAKARGMNVNLLTNGSLMTKELAEEIVTCVDSVSISIDSDNPAEHDAVRGRGGHAKAIQAIQMLRDAGPIFIHVNAVMTPVNLESTASFLEYATNVLKAEKITIAGTGIKVEDPSQRWGAANYQLTKPQQERLYQLSSEFYKRQASAQPISRWSLFRKQCGVGNGIVSLDPNGEIYPCQTLHRKEFECGNAFKLGLGTVLKESAVIKGTKMAAVDILPECKTCPVRYVCAGGCRSEAYTQEGDFLARNRMMCSSYFKGAVDQLWRAASIPVQDKERVFQSFETASYCAD